MYDRKRFHPIALIAYFIKTIRKYTVFAFLALLNIATDPLFAWLVIVVIIAISLIVSLVYYFTHTYSINKDNIIMYNGIFIKKEREITYERIQTIKQREWFFYKPFNVVQILIETGSTSDDEAEVSLQAVDTSVIDLIEEYRNRPSFDTDNNNLEGYHYVKSKEDTSSALREDIKNKSKSKTDQDIIYKYRMSHKDILLFAITDLNIFLLLIPLLVFMGEILTEFNFVLDLIPEAVFIGIDHLLAQAVWIVVLVLLMSSFILLITISIVKSFFYYFEFSVTCTRKTLTIEYGLFERKTQKIPLNKVQGIKVYQQVLRKFMGMSSVEVIIIGGQETKGESDIENKLLLLPLINSKRMYPALTRIFPTYISKTPEINLVGRGKLLYFWRWILLFSLIVIPLSFYFLEWLGLALLLIIGIILIFRWLDYRYQGYAFTNKNLIVIQNFIGFSKVQTFLNRGRIQAFDKKTSLFLFGKNMGHFEFHIKSGTDDMCVGLRFVDWDHINRIQSFFNKQLK